MQIKKFIFAPDIHWGYERKNGHKIPMHDPKAVGAMLNFAADFKPDTFILGGDTLDCGPISHHTKHKPGANEGLRLLADAQECHAAVIKPIQQVSKEWLYMIGNHEAWIDQLIEEMPALEGIVDIRTLLKLDKWKLVPQGGVLNLGKLSFVHGDQISGGEHVAKAAVINYERSIRFGHFHTAQQYTKTSPLDNKWAKTGVAVPCLCKKDLQYGKGKPNKWVQGFLYGYVGEGRFNDYVAIITEGQFFAEGKVYKG